jgi:hypothetical protein
MKRAMHQDAVWYMVDTTPEATVAVGWEFNEEFKQEYTGRTG